MQVSEKTGASEPTPIRGQRADRARRVADILRHQILAGAVVGTVPGEQELAAEHGTSRNTVREALALLRDEGLIDGAPKLGTRVAARKFDHGLDALLGLQETLKGHGTVRNEVRAATTITAPPAVARRSSWRPATKSSTSNACGFSPICR